MTGEDVWTVEDESLMLSSDYPQSLDDNILSSLGIDTVQFFSSGFSMVMIIIMLKTIMI